MTLSGAGWPLKVTGAGFPHLCVKGKWSLPQGLCFMLKAGHANLDLLGTDSPTDCAGREMQHG